jgi:hypothetical protein
MVTSFASFRALGFSLPLANSVAMNAPDEATSLKRVWYVLLLFLVARERISR